MEGVPNGAPSFFVSALLSISSARLLIFFMLPNIFFREPIVIFPTKINNFAL